MYESDHFSRNLIVNFWLFFAQFRLGGQKERARVNQIGSRCNDGGVEFYCSNRFMGLGGNPDSRLKAACR
jgi:hypothetical protein